MRLRFVVASLVLVALIAGALAARADSGQSRPRTPAKLLAAPAPPPIFAGTPLAAGCAPVPVAPGRRPRTPKAPAATPPSQQLLDAFAILRRPRTDADALSPETLEALKARGLAPVAADSSRLLRSTPSGGRAWVVPVPDVLGTAGVYCAPKKAGSREGLVVVAVGDAAGGGGGRLDDLVRGRAPVTLATCSGADHAMLSISGIVPDGVPAVFLTAPDGTAVRADVKDNGYEFLLPAQKGFERRYVVWTGGDGTPHVQSIVTTGPVPAKACQARAKLIAAVPRVSPDGFPCPGVPVVNPKAVVVPRRATPAQRRRVVAQMLYVVRCAGLGPFTTGAPVDRPVPVAPTLVLPGRGAPSVAPAYPAPAPAIPVRPRKRR
jgi:hypothetical protein